MKMFYELFRQVRFSLYIAIIANGIIVQWIVPLKYRCDVSNNECLTCGLRTAVNLFLDGKFVEAYASNKLILGIILLGIIMFVDVLSYVIKTVRNKPAQ
jgi:hypothetical protein